MATNIVAGQRISVNFKGHPFDVIVIDPNGLGEGRPTVGMGFRLMDRYTGLVEQTLSDWLTKESGFEGDRNKGKLTLKPPSGNAFRVTEILGSDNNLYVVIEASDWTKLAADVVKHPGKVRKSTQHKLIDFLQWFAAEGLYAAAYANLKGQFTAQDLRRLEKWMMARVEGVEKRKSYTDFLQEQRVRGSEFGRWTNVIYQGLFGMPADKMRKAWETQAGSHLIARNHIPEAEALKAVAFCERMVVDLFAPGDNITEIHRQAIDLTKRKFSLR